MTHPEGPLGRAGTPEGMARARAIVEGIVQGVCFRAETRRQAESLGLTGWVRNLPDGRVELVAEGRRDAVDRLLAWCHRGPEYSRVDDVQVSWEAPAGEFLRFGISH